MIDHSPSKKLEYDYIDDGIFIGTNKCCETHFAETLKGEGITADISLEEERIDAPFGVDFYVWIPVRNHTAPDQDKLRFGVVVLEELVAMGRKIYMHCQNGHGRAPTMAAAYFMKTRSISLEEAEAFIKSKRPAIHLEDVQRDALRIFLSQ